MRQARWLAIGVFVCASLLNYLDRQLLPALQPNLRTEFNISYADFGSMLSVFSIIYALSAPFMGLLIDRVGLHWGITIALGSWSLTTIATGYTTGLTGILICRAVLGVVQAGGVPCFGKASAMYLQPGERALGNSLSQIGISLGGILAPLLAAWCVLHYGWRTAFVIGGSLGLVWLPIWWFTASRIAPLPVLPGERKVPLRELLRDNRYWLFVAATMLGMTVYTLWSNWVTVYLTTWGLPATVVNTRLAWIPPLLGALGGICGGSLSLLLSRCGFTIHEARIRACWVGAIGMLATAAVPFMPNVATAAAAVAFSFFCATIFTVNLYSMPLEIFGRERAGIAIATLTSAYGLMQTFLSLGIGWVADHYGFPPVCIGIALLPLCAVVLLQKVRA